MGYRTGQGGTLLEMNENKNTIPQNVAVYIYITNVNIYNKCKFVIYIYICITFSKEKLKFSKLMNWVNEKVHKE